jgi:transposase InsO family protein
MSLRKEFVMLAIRPSSNISFLCRRFNISRKTGYKWLNRYQLSGNDDFSNMSRRPLHSPLQSPVHLEELIISVRDQHLAWGGRKIRNYLLRKQYGSVPSASTITRILHRYHRIKPESSVKHTAWHRFERQTPNELWQMDFKGHFAMDKGRCHPLTVLDDHSRYCVCLDACINENRTLVEQRLINTFRTYGLPQQINVDNGPPWGAEHYSRYTKLSLWMIRLGIRISHSRPYHPQTNGKDERFHRTLKAEVLQSRHFCNIRETQHAFDQWRPIYNLERPHEALNMAVPADVYKPSPREFPEVLPPIEYTPQDIIRKVAQGGTISLHNRIFRIHKALKGDHVAVRPTKADGIYGVYYCRQKIRTINFKEQNDTC